MRVKLRMNQDWLAGVLLGALLVHLAHLDGLSLPLRQTATVAALFALLAVYVLQLIVNELKHQRTAQMVPVDKGDNL